MAILFAGRGRFPRTGAAPGNVLNFAATPGASRIVLTWGDPPDIDRIVWAGTKIVRKIGSYPQNEIDGVLVIDSLIRDQFKATGFIDLSLDPETTYYYQAFPYSTAGAVNRDPVNRASARPIGGRPLAELPVGALVKFRINNIDTNHIIVHHGKPSAIYDTSFDGGTIILMKDIYAIRQGPSSSVNSNDYANGPLHSYLNDEFLNLIDAKIRAKIKQVKIPYRAGSGSSNTISSGANGLSTMVFLLSGHELNWTNSTNSYFTTNPEGTTLSYFAGTAAVDTKRIGYLDGTATAWWTRSPHTGTGTQRYGWAVNPQGGATGQSGSYGARPSLVLPNDTVVSATANPDGSYTVIV